MDSSKERYERRCNGVYLYHYTYNFFHNNRPGKPLPGHSSFLGLFWALFFVGGEGRTDCRRGGCMVVPGAVVSPGHTKRQKPQALSMTSGLLRRTGSRPCSRPSGSPSCALERNKKDALQRNSGIVLSPSCTLERNKESIKVVINGLI